MFGKTKAIKKLEEYKILYLKKMNFALEKEAEKILENHNIIVDGSSEKEVVKYMVVSTDLATVVRALKNGAKEVFLYGTNDMNGNIYKETVVALKAAGLEDITVHDSGLIVVKLVKEARRKVEEEDLEEEDDDDENDGKLTLLGRFNKWLDEDDDQEEDEQKDED